MTQLRGVTAVISTFQRPDACERAIASALAQDPPPVEVLVCDDGSEDSTGARIRAWEGRDARVRYLRLERNHGTPAPARNRGIREAQSELVALLDDDDEWLPGKLAAQLPLVESADVVGTNALTSDGAYFDDAPRLAWPGRRELLAANPVILSSAVVRRSALLDAGGFPEARRLRGVEDYAAWLAMADRGARFAILGDPFVRYETEAEDRFSRGAGRTERALAGLAWRRAAAVRDDPMLWRAAGNRSFAALSATARALRRSP